jgi:hypothetical protein
LPASADGVLDAGFDAFVREHWQDLAAGRAPHLEFLIPSRFEYLSFALSGVHDTTWDGEPARHRVPRRDGAERRAAERDRACSRRAPRLPM